MDRSVSRCQAALARSAVWSITEISSSNEISGTNLARPLMLTITCRGSRCWISTQLVANSLTVGVDCSQITTCGCRYLLSKQVSLDPKSALQHTGEHVL